MAGTIDKETQKCGVKMASRGQSRLTDHFTVKKKLPQLDNHKGIKRTVNGDFKDLIQKEKRNFDGGESTDFVSKNESQSEISNQVERLVVKKDKIGVTDVCGKRERKVKSGIRRKLSVDSAEICEDVIKHKDVDVGIKEISSETREKKIGEKLKEFKSKTEKVQHFDKGINDDHPLKRLIRRKLNEESSKISEKTAKPVKNNETYSCGSPETSKNTPKLKESDPTSSLPLPDKYKVLDKMFYWVDLAVSMLHNRKESCTFPKVKRAVEKMTSKTFELRHLGQISTVFPDAYSFAQEKCNEFNRESNWKRGNYQLVITANITDGSAKSDCNGLKSLSPSMLVQRRQRFTKNLIEIVKDHHDAFLKKLIPPIVAPRHKISSWHSRFDLNKTPEIIPSKLPEPPTCVPVITAKDFLEKIGGNYGKKIEDALKKVAQKNQDSVNKPEEAKPIPPALRGLPQCLIDKIRAKEMVKMQRDMTSTPEERKRRAMLSTLPELSRIIRCYFVAEKKTAVPIDNVITKVKDSLRATLESNEIKEYISFLSKLVPEWMQLVSTMAGLYVKIDKNKDINAVLDKIKQEK